MYYKDEFIGQESSQLEIVVIGHLSRDLIITPKERREALGGGTAYAMLAPSIGALGAGIISRVGSDFEQDYIDTLKQANLDLSGLRTSGTTTTRFVNEYDEDGKRTQHVEGLAPELRSSDLSPKHLQANILHFSPLLNEVHPSCVEAARTYGVLVSLDVQGYTRRLENGHVVPHRWTESDAVLRYVDVVKADAKELELMVDVKSESGAADHILSLGPRIVLVTKDRAGSTIYTRNAQVDIPLVLAKRFVDTTGCGDTYTIGFVLEYMRTGDVRRSGLFGATCASFNLETIGPYDMPNRDAVEARMKEYL